MSIGPRRQLKSSVKKARKSMVRGPRCLDCQSVGQGRVSVILPAELALSRTLLVQLVIMTRL